MLTEKPIKELHSVLKNGTSDSRKNWFAVGDYKKLSNKVGERETTPPEQVPNEIKKLLRAYNSASRKTINEIIDFHVKFECIHPFQDGNATIRHQLKTAEQQQTAVYQTPRNTELNKIYYKVA